VGSGSALLRKQKQQSRKIFSFFDFRAPQPHFLKGLKIFLLCERRKATRSPRGRNCDKSAALCAALPFLKRF